MLRHQDNKERRNDEALPWSRMEIVIEDDTLDCKHKTIHVPTLKRPPILLPWLEGVKPLDMRAAHPRDGEVLASISGTTPNHDLLGTGTHDTGKTTTAFRQPERSKKDTRTNCTCQSTHLQPPHLEPPSLADVTKEDTTCITSMSPNPRDFGLKPESSDGCKHGTLAAPPGGENSARRSRHRWTGQADLGFPLILSIPPTPTA
jgi:hypothetical protein